MNQVQITATIRFDLLLKDLIKPHANDPFLLKFFTPQINLPNVKMSSVSKRMIEMDHERQKPSKIENAANS